MSGPASDAIARYEHYYCRPLTSIASDLEHYVGLLRKWQRVQNLVSRETLEEVWTRHIADSLQVLTSVRNSDSFFLDLGSGGGLPAIPIAIALKGRDVNFCLVEPIGRKASFLRTVARELDLPLVVENRRIEALDSRETGRIDVITSRALASLSELCRMMTPFFGPNTRALLHKGREHGEEVREADSHWQFDVVQNASDTDAQAIILEISHLRARSPL